MVIADGTQNKIVDRCVNWIAVGRRDLEVTKQAVRSELAVVVYRIKSVQFLMNGSQSGNLLGARVNFVRDCQ